MEATAKPLIKVAALCGSLRKGSFNRGLLRAAMEISKKSINGLEIEYIEVSPLPMINTDLEVDGKYPPIVEAFRQKILAADSILFASPEYNYSVAPPLKNAIDWASRPPNVWADKAAAIVSAGGNFGGGRAQYHLRQIGVYLDLHFINKPEFFLHAFQPPAKFDTDGNLIDPAAIEKLVEVLLALQAFSLRLKGYNNHLPTRALEFSKESGGGTVERSIITAFGKQYLGGSLHTCIDYKLGRRAEALAWDDLEVCDQRKGVANWHTEFEHRRESHVRMERRYKIGLAGSWVLIILLMVLYWFDGDAFCRKNVYYKGLNLGFL